MTRNISLIGVATFIFISCNSVTTTQRRKNEIAKICFATGGCFGHCPFLAIEIDSSLNYKFYGGEYADKTGYFTGTVSQVFWDTLNMKFEHINYKHLDTSYEHSIDDLSIETILYFDNNCKHIRAQSASLPDSIMTVFKWVMNSYKTVALTKTIGNKIAFETIIQNPTPAPPMPTMKFIPPNETKK